MDAYPTLESLRLGAILLDVMQQAGFTQAELARKLGWQQTAICRLIDGRRLGQSRHLIPWLDACNVTGDARERILAMRNPCPGCGCDSLDHYLESAEKHQGKVT